jgi:hypothetical protein
MCACECQASAPNCQVTFSTFADLSCAIPESTYPFSQNLNCGAVSPAPQSVGSISATTAVTTSGSCTPVESEEVPAPSGDAVRVCAPSQPSVQDSCEQDSECVPLPSSPFQPRLCVYAEGDVACPGLGYSVPVTVARDGAVSDDRRCSDCDCPAPPVGESCSGSGETSGANGCDPLAIVPFDATCTLTQNFVKLSANLVATPGTCSATGGEPIGSFAATDPVTLCCTPTIE